MKTILESKNWSLLELPCGKKFKITKKDKEWLKTFPQARFSGGYVKVSRNIKTEYGTAKEEYFLHRLIKRDALINKTWQVDHINRDKLDNRRENLRVVVANQNCLNKNKKINSTSSKIGVSFAPNKKKNKPWRAYITSNKKQFHLGYFETEKEAIEARQKAEIKLWNGYEAKRKNSIKENNL